MRKAFTLIELLVVIAIIAILAAILFPVFAQAKLAAKKISDLSNTKQLTVAFIMYSTDYDDGAPIAVPRNEGTSIFVTPANRTPTIDPGLRDIAFANALHMYIKNWSIWKSPGMTEKWLPFGDPPNNDQNYTQSLMMNAYLNVFNLGAVTDVVGTPSFIPGTGKTGTPGFSFAWPLIHQLTGDWLDPTDLPSGSAWRFSKRDPDCVDQLGWFTGIAGDTADHRVFGLGANYAYIDGHAKFVPLTSQASIVADYDKPTGILTEYWVDDVDCNTFGCCYIWPLSPLK